MINQRLSRVERTNFNLVKERIFTKFDFPLTAVFTTYIVCKWTTANNNGWKSWILQQLVLCVFPSISSGLNFRWYVDKNRVLNIIIYEWMWNQHTQKISKFYLFLFAMGVENSLTTFHLLSSTYSSSSQLYSRWKYKSFYDIRFHYKIPTRFFFISPQVSFPSFIHKLYA
jgi:hypothetical protein